MLWQIAFYYPKPVPSIGRAILLPSCIASLPYLIRVRQCFVLYSIGRIRKDPNYRVHLLNALKYSTSLLPLMVSAYQQTYVGKEHYQLLDFALVSLFM